MHLFRNPLTALLLLAEKALAEPDERPGEIRPRNPYTAKAYLLRLQFGFTVAFLIAGFTLAVAFVFTLGA